MTFEERAKIFRTQFYDLSDELGKVIVGQKGVVESVLTCLFAGGNALLEGVPGLGKTLLIRSLSEALDLPFSRIQFTPDLMPADIVGTEIIHIDEKGQRTMQFRRGPLFSQIILADEINRATPKTQSALLEAMQEKTVSVAGTTYTLDRPFFVLATQNPIEMEGTYPLPEAQIDRFMFKLTVPHLGEDDLMEVINRTEGVDPVTIDRVLNAEEVPPMQRLARSVLVAEPVKRYAVRLVQRTHASEASAPERTKKYVKYGGSPRGIQALIWTSKVKALLEGRANVSEEDIRYATKPALRHRILLNFEGEADGVRTDEILDDILKTL